MRQRVVTLHIGGTVQPPQQPPLHPPSSAWKSPIPYLFGGLAAMLGLIAFALLILACSYWKLSGYQDNAAGENSGDANSDEKTKDACLNSILVIMAGDENPTFLATPSTSRASSFGDRATSSGGGGDGDGGFDGGEEEEVKETAVAITDDDKR